MDPDYVALPREQAAQLASITTRRLDSWRQLGLLVPSVDRRLSERNWVRLYDYQDLVQLLVAAELLRRGMTVRHIRRVVEHLRDRGYDSPLTEVRFATMGDEIYFQHADGAWEGDLRPDQVVFHQVITLAPLRARIRDAAQRSADTNGRIERRRGRLGSKPVVAGTRVPVDTIRRYLQRGSSVEDILVSFPVLTRSDVDAVQRAASVG